MDEDPDFDYEMEPHGADALPQSSHEEVMEDAGSDVVIGSIASGQHGSEDKASLDIDFHDTADLHQQSEAITTQAELALPTQSSSSYMEDAPVTASISAFPQAFSQKAGAAEQAASLVGSTIFSPPSSEATGVYPSFVSASVRPASPLISGHEQSSKIPDGSQEPRHESLEDHGIGAPLAQEQLNVGVSSTPANDPEEREEEELDQLEGAEEGAQSVNVAEDGDLGGQNDAQQGYEQMEYQSVGAVRVNFNGQDFVVWPATEIAAYLAAPDAAQGGDQGEHAEEELLQIEAPALEMKQDVLWQPLDSFFAGLREKSALGDFLDESQELHLAFPDLDLEISEDNFYCREITLDDLGQLHSGLGLATSLHIEVSERPRFITKYNDLAQQVAGLLGHQLQHESDDSEAEADTAEPHNAAIAKDEAFPVVTSGLSTGGSGPAGAASNDPETQQSHANGNPAAAESEQDASQAPVEPPRHQNKSGHGADDPDQAASIARGDAVDSIADASGTNQPHPVVLDTASSEALDEQDELDESSHVGEVAQGHAEEHQDGAGDAEQEQGGGGGEEEVQEEGEGEAEPRTAHFEEEPEDGDDEGQEGTGEAVGIGEEGGGDEAEEALAYGEEAYEEEEDEEAAYEGEEQEWYEEEEGEEAYETEAGGFDPEAEQTFYTTFDDASDGEEDELDEAPQHSAAEGAAAEDGAAVDAVSTNGEANGHEPHIWQGEFDPRMPWSAQRASRLTFPGEPFCCTATDEEQILEYTEEQDDDEYQQDDASALGASTAAQSHPQLKRLHADEDDENEDEAQYEEGDHEAESKRAKVM